MAATWLWKAAETASTLDFLTHKADSLTAFMPAHLDLVVTVACVLYLSAVVLWPTKANLPPVLNLPLMVTHCSIETCDFSVPNHVGPGRSHQAFLVSVANDSNAQPRGNIRGLRAEATYFGSDGEAYLTVPNVLWRNGEAGVMLVSGQSAQLLLLLVDPKGNPFVAGHTREWDYDGHQYAYSAYRSEVRKGRGTARVRLTYSFQKESSSFLGDDPADQAQEFNFKISLGDKPRIEQTP